MKLGELSGAQEAGPIRSVAGEGVCCDDAGVAVFEKRHSRSSDDQAFLEAACSQAVPC